MSCFDCFLCLWMILGAFQVLGAIYCVYQLRRKSVPQLWGVDWLDILFRLERTFGVVFDRADFLGLPVEARLGLTAGQLWDVLVTKLQSAGCSPPSNGWELFALSLSEALNIKPSRVTPLSKLYEDLGMSSEIC